MPTIGVAIITKNAARHFKRVLDSVAWADRIVVVDSGSTDETVAIAKTAGAHVTITPDWPGFGIQKNRAIDQLETDWVLVLDADEVVNPALADALKSAAAKPDGPSVYQMNRLSSLCGRWVKHSGWHPDWIVRFFKRGAARMSDDLVHERLLFEGQPARLRGMLLHYSYDDWESVLRKLDSYSTAAAKQRHAKGRRASMGEAIFRGFWAFMRTYIFKLGILDGAAGFTIAILNAEHSYYRALKLMHLRNRDIGKDQPPELK